MSTKSKSNPLTPLEPLFADPKVMEVLVDGPTNVYAERDGQLTKTEVKFASEKALRATIDHILQMGGEKFKPGQTVTDTRLADGSRVLAVLPPTAVNGPYLVVRKFFTKGMTWDALLGYNSLNREVLELLQDAVRARRNMLIAGGTGSGKTTILNLLAESIPADERVIVVGEHAELPVQHPRRICLEPHRQVGLSFTDLLITAARMRPDRIVTTEFHGPEAIHALQLASTGHDGSLMSIHATNAEEALARLEAMCLMANLGLGLGEIRAMIASALNVITCQARLPHGTRKLTEITELRGVENNRYVLQPLMRYNATNDKFEFTNSKPSWK